MAYQGDMVLVESSTIESVGYDAGDLIVRFKGGRTYRYKSVPSDIHEQFMAAPSKGQFLNAIIKHTYQYERE
jgi:hypothetical protein